MLLCEKGEFYSDFSFDETRETKSVWEVGYEGLGMRLWRPGWR